MFAVGVWSEMRLAAREIPCGAKFPVERNVLRTRFGAFHFAVPKDDFNGNAPPAVLRYPPRRHTMVPPCEECAAS